MTDNNKEMILNDCIRVGYGYVPIQKAVMTNLYSPETALERGTVFPILDIPLGVYGFQFCKKENMK